MVARPPGRSGTANPEPRPERAAYRKPRKGGVQAALCGKHRQGRWFESTIRHGAVDLGYLGTEDRGASADHLPGHRLAPWLGHVMVADQESSRPLLDAAEICKLTASDMILLVAGYPPIRARRFRYYEHPLFAARANLPALKLKPGGPYPFRPRQHPNPWAAKHTIVPPPDAVPEPPKPDKAPPSVEGSERSQLVIPLAPAACHKSRLHCSRIESARFSTPKPAKQIRSCSQQPQRQNSAKTPSNLATLNGPQLRK